MECLSSTCVCVCERMIAMQGLRLLYVGQRRQEQLQRTQAAKTKRHGLQHVSGERVVETEQSPVAMTQTLPEALAAFNL